jgi:peptidoglycan-associated lipoprotein
MKRMQFGNVLVIALAFSVMVAGCKHKPVALTPLPGARTGNPGDVGPGNTLGNGSGMGDNGANAIAANAPGSHAGWAEDAAALKADIVYFDYDSSVVKSDEKSKVAAVADYLKGNPGVAVRIEGNCDERGTEEYNRSLGERRALAVREELAGLGIDPSRVDTISYGKDRPADTGHTEAAHAKNRRDEFVVLTAPK